ncbi:MAG: hypothetical protein CM1200mP39_30220 [Dehalococcoidia bacterium]|nr:MAG: hypothetical protein CM1200mP39_30220 [Dehalococcoidia bacterium]
MVTAQGADHTAGNVPKLDCTNMTVDEVVAASLESQLVMASSDSLGFVYLVGGNGYQRRVCSQRY